MKVHSKTEYVASQKLLHKSLDEYLYLSLFFPPILLGSESSRDHSFSKSAGFDLSGLSDTTDGTYGNKHWEDGTNLIFSKRLLIINNNEHQYSSMLRLPMFPFRRRICSDGLTCCSLWLLPYTFFTICLCKMHYSPWSMVGNGALPHRSAQCCRFDLVPPLTQI